MKNIITIVTILLIGSSSFAATLNKKPAKRTSVQVSSKPINNDSMNTISNQPSSNPGINWSAGFGLGTAGSVFHFGPLLNGMISVSNTADGEIFLGGETGFLLGPGTVSTWIIPILVSSQMIFAPKGEFTPYVGLAMGVGIYHASVLSISLTSTDFAILAKGGVYFGSEKKYFVELPLGTLGAAFAIIPTVGMKF